MESIKRTNITGLRVGVVGYGVVGSAAAHKLYDLGNEVYVNDIRKPENLKNWNDAFIFKEKYSIRETDATFLVLPTPSMEERMMSRASPPERMHLVEGKLNESLDKSFYEPVIEDLGKQLASHDDYHLFVVRSTVEPGTTRDFGRRLEQIAGKELGRDFGLGFMPEFLRAYNNTQDEADAKMIVMGHYDERSRELMEHIYQYTPLDDKGKSRLFPMGLEEAELVKLESNAINTIWISLNNSREEFYELLAEKGIEVDYNKMTQVFTNMTESFYNPKYGTSAGVFVGGTCLKKDPSALHSWAVDTLRLGCDYMRFLERAITFNTHLQKRILNDHEIPTTLANGIPERLRGRDHETYDNIRKIENAMKEVKEREEAGHGKS